MSNTISSTNQMKIKSSSQNQLGKGQDWFEEGEVKWWCGSISAESRGSVGAAGGCQFGAAPQQEWVTVWLSEPAVASGKVHLCSWARLKRGESQI